jgi:hypothetical protein
METPGQVIVLEPVDPVLSDMFTTAHSLEVGLGTTIVRP